MGSTNAGTLRQRAPEPTYHQTIEAEWMRLQQRPQPLSPMDWADADAWHEGGIPLKAVILGMRRSFRSFRPTEPGTHIRRLAYCQPAILEAWEELAPQLAEEHWRPAA